MPPSTIHRMRAIAALALVLLLTGCVQLDLSVDAEPTTEPQAETECLTVGPGAIAGLQWGLDDRNGQGAFTISRAAAIKNPGSDLSWFVVGEFSGPGIDDATGVWSTVTDPATAPDTSAFLSVDGMAAEFSSYVQPPDYSAALPGVDEVKACLQ